MDPHIACQWINGYLCHFEDRSFTTIHHAFIRWILLFLVMGRLFFVLSLPVLHGQAVRNIQLVCQCSSHQRSRQKTNLLLPFHHHTAPSSYHFSKKDPSVTFVLTNSTMKFALFSLMFTATSAFMVVPSNPARSMKLAAEPPMDDEGTSKSSRQQGVFGTCIRRFCVRFSLHRRTHGWAN